MNPTNNEKNASSQVIQEIIGRSGQDTRTLYPARVSADFTRADYAFWDALRWGKQAGYELGGLFAQAICEIVTAWVLGDGLTLNAPSEATQKALDAFLQVNLQLLVECHEDMLALGDAYVVVNADASLTLVPAAQVTVNYAPTDMHQIESVVITTRLPKATITDAYTASKRTISTLMNSVTTVEEFPNLLGVIPVVHFANDRRSNEVYGRPIYERLLTLFGEYDDVLSKGIAGVKLMANPVPVVEGLEDPQGTKVANASYTDTYTDAKGTAQTEYVVDFDQVEMWFLGKGGNFKFASPGAFTENMKDTLKKLFQLMLQTTQIPEWVWGGAVASSKASVDAQLPAFERIIDARRRKIEAPLRQVVTLYLRALALFTPRIEQAFVIDWRDITPEDVLSRWNRVQYLDQQGYVSRQEVIAQAEVVADPAQALAEADAERATRDEAQRSELERSLEAMLKQDQQQDSSP